MPKVTQAIQNFFDAIKASHNGPDLLDRWTPQMETQINVAVEKGEPVAGKRNTYEYEGEQYWNIRIPKHANTEPEFKDYTLRWSLAEHADGIGCTGWDWVAKRSRWVGFDFDSITGHAAGVGVTDEALEKVKAAAAAIPWVEVRKSTGGNGLHLYVYLDAIPTANHTEHAALGRAILGLMASETGFDFASQIDVCGGNMWVWHRKMTAANQGLALLKPAEKVLGESDLPKNWHDHVEVVTRRRAKVRVGGVDDAHLDPFEALASSRRIVPLDDKHKAVIDALIRSGFTSVWVPDHHLLQTHTKALQNLQEDPDMTIAGFFKTNSEGRDPGTANCFLFPLDKGGWKVYRFGLGIAEAETWEQDGDGWTTCFFNRAPNLKSACRAMGGFEDVEKGEFVFDTAEQAIKAAEALGRKLPLPANMLGRETRIKAHKDGRLVVKVVKKEDDEGMKKNGWLAKKGTWVQVFESRVPKAEADQTDGDRWVRALKSLENKAAGYLGWGKDNTWVLQSQSDCIAILQKRLAVSKAEAQLALAGCVENRYTVVTLPFQPVFPGERRYNVSRTQFRFAPCQGPHPHYDLVLSHLGKHLDSEIADPQCAHRPWLLANDIRTGADFLRYWIACVLRFPFGRLPLLFFYSIHENSGKSTFHLLIERLITGGVVSAVRSLRGDFNPSLAEGIVAVVEEIDFSADRQAHHRLKDLIVSETLTVRPMYGHEYRQPNSLHFVVTANSPHHLIIPPTDTRHIVVEVEPLANEIPWETLKAELDAEGPAFLRTILDLEIGEVPGRLRMPTLDSPAKRALHAPLAAYIEDGSVSSGVRLAFDKDAKTEKKLLYDHYKTWCFESSEHDPLEYASFCGSLLAYVRKKEISFDPNQKIGPKGKQKHAFRGVKLENVKSSRRSRRSRAE